MFLATLATSLLSIEIEGFRDFKWGASPTSLNGKELVEVSRDDREKTSDYKMQNENVYIGTVDADAIKYTFFEDKLYSVFIFYHGESYFVSLKQTLDAKYGRGKKEDILGYSYSWISKKGRIAINFEPIREYGSIMMIGNKVFDEYIKHKEKLSKESSKDL